MKTTGLALFFILFVQALINLCHGNHPQWISNDITLDRSPLPSAIPYDRNAFFELNLSDDNAIKNADKLKTFLKELQRYVAVMGKPRYGRDLSGESRYRKFENKRIRKFKLLKS